MKHFLLLVVLLIGCQDYKSTHKSTHTNPEDHTESYRQICLNGVKYWNEYSRLAPVFNKESKVELCNYDDAKENFKDGWRSCNEKN
jgi:hypothetical protein